MSCPMGMQDSVFRLKASLRLHSRGLGHLNGRVKVASELQERGVAEKAGTRHSYRITTKLKHHRKELLIMIASLSSGSVDALPWLSLSHPPLPHLSGDLAGVKSTHGAMVV